MKQLLISLGFLSLAFNTYGQSSDKEIVQPYAASHALLIGNSEYRNNWNELPGVQKDLKAVKATLELHGFEVDIGMNYSKVQMDSAYSSFIASYGNEEANRLLFYYAGHGETVRTSYGESLSYLIPIDAPVATKDIGRFQGSSMEMTQIEIYAKRIQSKHALFLFDACFAGSIFGQSRALEDALSYQFSQPVRQFITSGDADEVVPDESIFRKELVRALTSAAADENEDGFLSGSELGTFLQDQVVEKTNGRQHPQYGKIRNPALDKGDFFFLMDPKSQSVVTRSSFQPKVGQAAELNRYGLLEVNSDLSGTLILNERVEVPIQQGKPTTFEDLVSGTYNLTFTGEENWKGSVVIAAGKTSSVHIDRYSNKAHRNLFMSLTYVEAGGFEMGNKDGAPDEMPIHRVNLPAFEMGTYEVTVGQFKAFVDTSGYITELERMSGSHLVFDQKNGLQKKDGLNWRYGPDGNLVVDMQKPVVFVSWNDAMAFTKWMTANYDGTYRLPTEAEWEFAAQGGIRGRLSETDSLQKEDIPKFELLGKIGSREVMPNEIGLAHMNGSLSEWCLDWYDKNYYRQSPLNAPMGPNVGKMKVLRGGSWINEVNKQSDTFRKKTAPNLCSFSDGFRVVRVDD